MIWDTVAVYYRLYIIRYYKANSKGKRKMAVKHALHIAST